MAAASGSIRSESSLCFLLSRLSPLPLVTSTALARHHMPSEGAARHEHTDRVPYTAWAGGGYVTLTPGAVTENAFVDEWIAAGEKQHGWKVIQTGYDGHNATDLAIAMNQRRSNEDFCVEIF